jgi:hypothetical protein
MLFIITALFDDDRLYNRPVLVPKSSCNPKSSFRRKPESRNIDDAETSTTLDPGSRIKYGTSFAGVTSKASPER